MRLQHKKFSAKSSIPSPGGLSNHKDFVFPSTKLFNQSLVGRRRLENRGMIKNQTFTIGSQAVS